MIGIRDEVLCKPGHLAPEERRHVAEHSVTGEADIFQRDSAGLPRPRCARAPNERFDGKGYPDGLVGEAIPLTARILAVADSCDAMMCTRLTDPPWPRPGSRRSSARAPGTQWDPSVVKSFFACRHELLPGLPARLGQSVYLAVEARPAGIPETSMPRLPVEGPSRLKTDLLKPCCGIGGWRCVAIPRSRMPTRIGHGSMSTSLEAILAR